MLIRIAVICVASLGMSGLAASQPVDENDMQAARVIVEGPMKRVYEFHQNLENILAAVLVDGDLGNAGVDCNVGTGGEIKSCDTLSGAGEGRQPPVTVTYYIYRDQERLTAFVLAWGKLQDRARTQVSLNFDINVPEPDCSQALQPCVAATQCPNTVPRRCDKNKGAPCTSCGLPPP